MRLICLLLIIGIFVFIGCASFSTYQSPKVLDPDEMAIGVGISEVIDPEDDKMAVGPMDIYGRFGIAKNLDVGVKLTEFYPGIIVFGDMKYQVIDEPIVVSADLGYSHFHIENITTYGIYPMILFGKESLYGGLKVAYLSSTGTVELFDEAISFSGSTSFPGLVIGASFGNRTKFLLEGNFYFDSGLENPLILIGFALQHSFLFK